MTTEKIATASGSYPIGGDLPVVRLGYGMPIPGTSSVDHLESNTAAAAIELTDEEFEALSEAV